MAYATLTNRAGGDLVPEADHDQIRSNFDVIARGFCQGRLTLTTQVPEADSVGAATNVYFSPYGGNLLSLFNGSIWVLYEFSELTLSLSGLAANTNHDVFVYDNAGTVTLEALAWTNATTRATDLTTQNGVLVKTGATTRRYLGTFRTTGAIGQTTDIVGFRYLWNYYNRIRKAVQLLNTTNSWTYASTTWRAWNNSAANSIGVVSGWNEANLDVTFTCMVSGTGSIALALDAAGVDDIAASQNTGSILPLTVRFSKRPGMGYHFLQLNEVSVSGTTTFYGDNNSALIQSGAEGSWEC